MALLQDLKNQVFKSRQNFSKLVVSTVNVAADKASQAFQSASDTARPVLTKPRPFIRDSKAIQFYGNKIDPLVQGFNEKVGGSLMSGVTRAFNVISGGVAETVKQASAESQGKYKKTPTDILLGPGAPFLKGAYKGLTSEDYSVFSESQPILKKWGFNSTAAFTIALGLEVAVPGPGEMSAMGKTGKLIKLLGADDIAKLTARYGTNNVSALLKGSAKGNIVSDAAKIVSDKAKTAKVLGGSSGTTTKVSSIVPSVIDTTKVGSKIPGIADDLTTYGKAYDTMDVATMEKLSAKYPEVPDFQLHKAKTSMKAALDSQTPTQLFLPRPGSKVGIRKPDQVTVYGRDFVIENMELPKTKGAARVAAEKVLRKSLDEAKNASEVDLRAAVTQNLTTKAGEFEEMFFGNTQDDIQKFVTGDKTAVSSIPLAGPVLERIEEKWQKYARLGQEQMNKLVAKGLVNEHQSIRTVASAMRGFFGGLGTTNDLSRIRDLAIGKSNAYQEYGHTIQKNLYKAIKSDKVALENVNAFLDPELAKTSKAYGDLSDSEKVVADALRVGYDYIHDWNFSKGFIDKDTYIKFKGKYVGRGYRTYEVEEEVTKSIAGKFRGLEDAVYGPRKDITDWMKENNVNDPVYMFSKRLSQTGVNSAVNDYTVFLQRQGMFSDVEKPGYTKLANNRAYGELSDKYVPNYIAQDFKGFFFTNELMNKLYDFFKVLDSPTNIIGKARQIRKSMLTAYAPPVQLGNIGGDWVFGFNVGIDPFTLNKGIPFAVSEVKSSGPVYRFLLENNVLKTNISQTDLLNAMNDLEKAQSTVLSGQKIWDVTKNVASIPTRAYGAVDDVYKISAFKALLDNGVSMEDALRTVKEGFQNYSNVGKFYDFASKTPIIGNPFVKFAGDLVRIMKNAAVNRPLHLAGFLTGLYLAEQATSKLWSKESPEDRNVRVNRPFVPKIPGLNIPLVWQTPYGELNVARYVSPFYTYPGPDEGDVSSTLGRLAPYSFEGVDYTSNPAGKFAVDAAMSINDPLFGPFIQAALNSDFRGKPITDPNETVYKESTATEVEKALNVLTFLRRQYQPSTATALENVALVAKTGKDIYDRERTVGQTIGGLGGIKMQQYGPTEVKKQVETQLKIQDAKIKDARGQVTLLSKQLAKGEITRSQFDSRIKIYQNEIKSLLEERKNVVIKYNSLTKPGVK